MKCQGRKGLCHNVASFVRDIPNLGESLCFCVDCVNHEIMHYGKDFGWYILTPQREKEETASEDMMQIWRTLIQMSSGSFFKK